jgi:CRP-like cAMP-binding protein
MRFGSIRCRGGDQRDHRKNSDEIDLATHANFSPPGSANGPVASMDGRGPLVTKLSRFILLSDEDVRVLDALCLNEERIKADTDIVRQGDVPRSAFVLTHGMAFRYRLTPDGKRQILTFMIPGDIFGLHIFLLRSMDHSIATLVPTRIATIPRATVFDLFEHHPRIGAALWWSALQQNAINRERIVALGRRSARGRVAYLLCELVWRQRAVRLAEDDAIRLPLTQVELADTLGLTAVHVNRILQGFRRDNLIALMHHRLTLLDVEKLQKIAGFNQDYLHLDSATTEVRSYIDKLEREREAHQSP